LIQRSRVEGEGVWLELLADREKWNAQPPEAQYAVIGLVGQRLGSGYELAGVRVWECASVRTDEGDHARGLQVPVDRLGGDLERRTTTTTLSHRLATFRHVATGMELNLLPGVREDFRFEEEGCPECPTCDGHRLVEGNPCDECGGVGSLPLHVPAIKPFLFGRYPVTRDQHWPAVTGPVDEEPVTGLSHAEAMEWLKSLGLRLPSSAEWEHGCRAGSTTRFFWGDGMDDRYCWHSGNIAEPFYEGQEIHGLGDISVNFGPRAPSEHDEAGRFNAFGLVDMIGNVWEWLDSGGIAGGSFRCSTLAIEDSFMQRHEHPDEDESIGFRACCSIPGMETP